MAVIFEKNIDKLNFLARVVPVLHNIYKKIIKCALSWFRYRPYHGFGNHFDG